MLSYFCGAYLLFHYIGLVKVHESNLKGVQDQMDMRLSSSGMKEALMMPSEEVMEERLMGIKSLSIASLEGLRKDGTLEDSEEGKVK